MKQSSNFQKFLNYALIFLIILLTWQLIFPKDKAEKPNSEDLTIQLKQEIQIGKIVSLSIKNNTNTKLTLPNECPSEPFSILEYQNGEWLAKTAKIPLDRCDPTVIELAPSESRMFSYEPWQATLFREVGRYRIEIPVTIGGVEKIFQKEFKITKPGIFGRAWQTIFIQPIYNALIFFTDLAGNSFGWGIVLLTFAIRLILFVPFQKSMVSQRRLQKLQPELEEIKKRFKGNQQLQATETMALYKKHKVNPLGSCLPVLIQMPFLLALFWIVRGGLGENNLVLLYAPLATFQVVTVSTDFFGLSLVVPNLYVLPVVVGLLQFFQMKLAFARAQKNKTTTDNSNPLADVMGQMTKYMRYILPIMIAIFTATMPAAVGLYWGVSTIFGIGQQLLVNKLIKQEMTIS